MKNDKKRKKHLTLNKETIAVLSADNLPQVAGGDYFSKISVCIFNPCNTQ